MEFSFIILFIDIYTSCNFQINACTIYIDKQHVQSKIQKIGNTLTVFSIEIVSEVQIHFFITQWCSRLVGSFKAK